MTFVGKPLRRFDINQRIDFIERLVKPRTAVWASVLIGWLVFVAPSNAADLEAASIPTKQASVEPVQLQPVQFLRLPKADESNARLNSLLFFGGRMSTTNLGSTLVLNLNETSATSYDNFIVGVAYNRDIFNLGYGFYLGGEVGLADRFGKYKICCDPVQKSSIVQSPEIWAGVRVRYSGWTFLDTVRLGFAMTFGLSAVDSSIGSEAFWSAKNGSTNHVLYYLGPELVMSFPGLPNIEVVYRIHHRSGGKTVPFLPTISGRGEGYNANVVGIRYWF